MAGKISQHSAGSNQKGNAMKCHYVLTEKDKPNRNIGERETPGGVPNRGDTVSFQDPDLADRVVIRVDRLVGRWPDMEGVAATVWVR